MSPAQVDLVPADPELALEHVEDARRTYADANLNGLASRSQYILLYTAAHTATAAALLAIGRRVTAGEGGHAVQIQEAVRHLGRDHAALLPRLDRGRRLRNRVQYDAVEVTRADLENLRTASAEAIDAIEEFVRRQIQ